MHSGHEQRRVLLTGAAGQLAADLATTFSAAGFDVHGYSREELDITSDTSVAAAIDRVRPDLILNPAAYNRVDDAETHPDTAFAVNAFGPRILAHYAEVTGATLVHYSTDYVVDGRRRSPYGENDPPFPSSAYATSKLAGEYFARALTPRHYVLRVCGLFGPAGRQTRHGNFVETMLRAATAGLALRVVSDQVVAPTSTRDAAVATLDLVESGAPFGLYHCTASGETSWFDYTRAILDLAGVTADLQATTAAEYGAPARRPAYSILDNSKLELAGAKRPRHWREALAEYLTQSH